MMQPQMQVPLLTSKYYWIRMSKSKDIFEFYDAWKAYAAFKKSRQEYAVSAYCKSAKNLDVRGMMAASVIPVC